MNNLSSLSLFIIHVLSLLGCFSLLSAPLTELEKDMGIPEDFPKVGAVYPGILYMPQMVAEFRIETFEESTGVYKGIATSYRIVLPMTDDPETILKNSHKSSGQFEMRKDDLGQWHIELSRIRSIGGTLESVHWIQTSAGPALVGNWITDINTRELFQMSPFPNQEPHPFLPPKRSILQSEIVDGGIIRRWTASDRLAHNATRGLAQTADGAIWIATTEGLSRFDGHNFINFYPDSASHLSLPDENIHSLLALSDGRLAIGTKSEGVFIFDGEHFQRTPLSKSSNQDTRLRIQGMVESANGDLWAYDSRNLYCLRPNGSFLVKSVDDLNPNWPGFYLMDNLITSVIPGESDHIFISATGSLLRWNFQTDEILYCHNFSHQAGNLIQLQNDDFIWSTPEGFRQTGADLKVSFAYDTQLRGSGVSLISPSSAGGHWSYIRLPEEKKDKQIPPGQHGLFYFHHGKAIHYSDFPSDLWIDHLMEDSQGNLWFATSENGLYLFIPPYVENHKKKFALGSRYHEVNSRHSRRERLAKSGSYEEDSQKDLIDLNQEQELPSEFRKLINDAPYNRNQLLMEFVPLGTWEAHSENSEFYAVAQGRSMTAAIAAGMELPTIPVLVEIDGKGKTQWYFCPELPQSYKYLHSGGISNDLGIYLATDAGTLRLAPHHSSAELWDPISPSLLRGVESNIIWVDTQERVWIGMEHGGLYCDRWDADRQIAVTTGVNLEMDQISTIFEDSRGDIWVTNPESILRIQKNGTDFQTLTRSFPHIRKHHSKPKPIAVIEGNKGYLWYSFGHGIQGYSLNQLHAYIEGKLDSPETILLDESSGMKNVSAESLFYPGASKDKEGRLFFNMIGYEVSFLPSQVIQRNQPPGSLISRVSSGNRVYYNFPYLSPVQEMETEHLLPPEAGHGLNFNFSTANLNPTQSPYFSHRLIGYSDSDIWSPPLPYSNAFYPGLRPGSYRFEVKAISANGRTQSEPAVFNFRVEPYFHQTLPFKAGFTSLCLGMIALWTWNLDQKRKQRLKLEKEREIEKERLRITQHMHDDLGSALARIRIRVGMAMKSPECLTRELTQELGEFTAEASKKMREIIWYLNPETCSYTSFCDYMGFLVTSYFRETRISVILKIEDSESRLTLNSELKREWIHITQNLMANILQYSHATQVKFQLREMDSKWIEMEISDNGIGCDLDIAQKPDSTGWSSIHSRVQKLGGTFQLSSMDQCGLVAVVRLPIL